LSKSLSNTNSQTLFFFLLTNPSCSSYLNADSLITFLKNSNFKQLFQGYHTEDYQIFSQLLRQTLAGDNTRTYESVIQKLADSGMDLNWISEDEIFANSSVQLG
jgi:hypothetical protein